MCALCETRADAGSRAAAAAASLRSPTADRLEVAGVGGDQERHAIELDGLAHARHQAFGEAIEVEVAVQLAREADERLAIVVAIAIERAVDRLLQPVLHRLGQQDHDDGGEERDDPAMLGLSPSTTDSRPTREG